MYSRPRDSRDPDKQEDDHLKVEEKEFYEGIFFMLRVAACVYLVVTACVLILYVTGVIQ